MSKENITVTKCDGCGKSDIEHNVIINRTWTFMVGNFNDKTLEEPIRVDICLKCSDGGVFICLQCKAAHKHESLCPVFQSIRGAVYAM